MHSIILAITGAVVLMSGCASMEREMQAATDRETAIRIALIEAERDSSSVKCATKTECEKAFTRAKIFVHDRSSMRVQFADDTTITTYNPNDYGLIGLTVTRRPGEGDSATLTLKVSCYDIQYNLIQCAPRMTKIYNDFPKAVTP
jgi:outer membrane murein-binding lipoprotein Lpp